ncbi:MAG: baseplate J/gp47 family protein [Cyclobacteriaceae bacterium]
MSNICTSENTPADAGAAQKHCLSQNPLVRDGVSQQQRLLKTLLPSYVNVDERSMKDLFQFVLELGAEIQYYEYDGASATVIKDTWDIFFKITDENWDQFDLEGYLTKLKIQAETKPHLALFFGFLYIFRIAQEDLNTITSRHLDFYYRDVLQLKENPAVPDQAAVIFHLAKNVVDYLVKKGTLLKAGKDDTGVERIYQVVEDIVVNKGNVKALKAVFANIQDRLKDDVPGLENDHRLYLSNVANSSDGEGGKIQNEEMSWKTFGQPEFEEGAEGFSADRAQPEIGFAFASPILFLAEGIREISLELTFPSNTGLGDLNHDQFIVRLCGEDGWLVAGALATSVTQAIGNKILLKRTLGEDQPAVIAYNEKALLKPFKTQWPVIEVLLNTNNDYDPFIYKHLKGLQPQKVDISVHVTGVKDLILQNDHAVLDPSKPFMPFGNRPYVGSKFYIGSWEVFQKQLSSLSLRFQWNDLPIGNFSDYYTNYDYNTITDTSTSPLPSSTRKNSSFNVDIKGLDNKSWKDLVSTNTALFTNAIGDAISDGNDLPTAGSHSQITSIDGSNLDDLSRQADMKKLDEYDVNTQKGFIRLTLQGVDFGHSVFPNAYAKQAIELAKEYPAGWAQLPNAPYTPSLQELSLEYESSVTYEFTNTQVSNTNSEQFFYLEPFGVKEVIKKGATFPFLLPQFDHEGLLYIGITDLIPPQTLSLLFQVAEGSANPNREVQEVNWAILSNNEWVPLDEKAVLSDSTNDLLTSGILQLALPEEATKDNTLLPSPFYWIRATVTEQSDAISKLIDIRAQAVMVKFKDQNNDPDHLRIALSAGSISKLEKAASAVDKVEQPYASFGGEVREESRDYYTRISERLRHKHRAITIWDNEHMILQQFPSVYKVKCINHTRFEGTLENYSEMAPGHITVVVVSNVQNKNAVDPLRPMTSLATLDKIHSYTDGLNPMSAEIHVKNPIYEEVKVSFKVKFFSSDFGYYRNKLERELKEFLSPWSSGCGTDITFGGKIHRSVILNFVEERSYVDYISCFKMYHIVPLDPEHDPNKDREEAIATTAVSILGSADGHEIMQIDVTKEDCDCPENEVGGPADIASADECPCYPEITSLEEKTDDEIIDLT